MNTFRQLSQPTGRLIQMEDDEYLFFGGTAYLGLLNHAAYIELYVEGIRKLGLNNGTSRNNNVQLGIYGEAESVVASRFGFEDAILLSSGYLAGQLTVKGLVEKGEILYAPHSHPALWLGGNPRRGGTFEDWIADTVRYINGSSETSFVLISNAMDNMTPMMYDFGLLRDIDVCKKITLLLDDSHGIGVVNFNRPSVDITRFPAHVEVLVVASLAKGMGTDAGIIFGKKATISKLRRSTFFTGASPGAPAAIYALLHGEQIYGDQFEKLQRNISQFANLAGSQLNHAAQFAVFTSGDAELYDYLVRNKILISSFPYPLEDDPLLNRIVISGQHRQGDLERLAGLVNVFY